MSIMRFVVPALAVAGHAVAQSTCSAATTTIQSAADASALASCTTFTGSIAIATGTTDNIALDGIVEIQGSLIADNVTQITEISASTLETITDSFTLNGLTVLSSLNFPVLTNVETISWEALPALQGLSFSSTGVQTASSVSIQNTQLDSLTGIDLQIVDTFLIANNPYLEEINMQLGNISTSLTIEANGRNCSATFPNLDWAYNMTLRNVSTFTAPSLASLNGSLGFYSNDFLTVSCPNLTTVGGSLSFVSNVDLTNVTMGELTSIGGGFQIANNTEYKQVTGFGSLKTIGGALDFYGNFTSIELPDLSDVRGAFNIQSSSDITTDCSHFSSLSGSNNVIKGTYFCSGEVSKPSSSTSGVTTSSASSSSSSSTSTASGAATALYMAPVTGIMGVLAAVFGLL